MTFPRFIFIAQDRSACVLVKTIHSLSKQYADSDMSEIIGYTKVATCIRLANSKKARDVITSQVWRLYGACYIPFPTSKTICPGLGGTSPVSHTFCLAPSVNSISPPSVMMPPASSCLNQFLAHSCPLIFTPWT